MEYTIYQLEFKTGVHFGTGMLNESACTFKADQIFSALYIEALKLNLQQQLYDAVKKGNLLISDAFPYIGQQYMIPKPMIYVEPVNRGESKQKKAYKKMKFIPVECLSDFLSGKMDLSNDPMEHYGHYFQQTMAAVRTGEETLPYRVGTFYYGEGCGLYIIAAYQSENEKCLMEKLLTALSYTGIGGKKSGGLGKYRYNEGQIPEQLLECLQKKSDRYMLLSVALPEDEELDNAM